MSKIPWTDKTLNVSTGCTKISAGCQNCYAEKMHKRLNAMGIMKYSQPFDKVTLHPEELKKPFKWKKPRMIFINSMSDLFHKDVPDEFILEVFAMMNKCQRHTFQVLTKRPERAVQLKDKLLWSDNIWMGVTVEEYLHRPRVARLVELPAKVKFISFEPLIGMAMLSHESAFGEDNLLLENIDWVIVGGETGPGARKIEPEWVDNIFRQTKPSWTDGAIKDDKPFFFKGWGTALVKKSYSDYCHYRGIRWKQMPTCGERS